ncbi:hypothetical protein ColLi_13993 [Colletotrichum liriopes]|uniref:Uncharacterized protein n=1 Tax=Colletotrichum liriopes TaxID=708192 RepID=A0AA37H2M1_9PEZI|nr:hypothetical protein ColLi_13993 [Colletotrichum liriopes]
MSGIDESVWNRAFKKARRQNRETRRDQNTLKPEDAQSLGGAQPEPAQTPAGHQQQQDSEGPGRGSQDSRSRTTATENRPLPGRNHNSHDQHREDRTAEANPVDASAWNTVCQVIRAVRSAACFFFWLVQPALVLFLGWLIFVLSLAALARLALSSVVGHLGLSTSTPRPTAVSSVLPPPAMTTAVPFESAAPMPGALYANTQDMGRGVQYLDVITIPTSTSRYSTDVEHVELARDLVHSVFTDASWDKNWRMLKQLAATMADQDDDYIGNMTLHLHRDFHHAVSLLNEVRNAPVGGPTPYDGRGLGRGLGVVAWIGKTARDAKTAVRDWWTASCYVQQTLLQRINMFSLIVEQAEESRRTAAATLAPDPAGESSSGRLQQGVCLVGDRMKSAVRLGDVRYEEKLRLAEPVPKVGLLPRRGEDEDDSDATSQSYYSASSSLYSVPVSYATVTSATTLVLRSWLAASYQLCTQAHAAEEWLKLRKTTLY